MFLGVEAFGKYRLIVVFRPLEIRPVNLRARQVCALKLRGTTDVCRDSDLHSSDWLLLN